MTRPIYNTLKSLNKKNMHSFCMPAHKRNSAFHEDFYNLDYTEIDETDNLHNPSSVIKKSMETMSKIFGSDHSYFLVNGSSSGILASILSHLTPDDCVLVCKNSHISVYNGILLSGATPIYITPTIKNGIPCSVDIQNIEYCINMHKNIKAFIITSPTYEGFVPDIAKISDILHKKNILLIVDEAHGAHFSFSKNFPTPSLCCGADISIQSFHKTLPSLTQCAVLHIKGSLVNKYMIEKYLSIVQTTSPSYMFMCSIEYATHFMHNNAQLIDDYTKHLNLLRQEFSNLKCISLLDKNFLKDTNFIDLDISRFTFFINSDTNGNYINKRLKEHNIQIEMYSMKHIVAISTVCDTIQSLQHLKDSIFKIDSELTYKKTYDNIVHSPYIQKCNTSLRDVLHKKRKKIHFSKSENMVSSDFITPYPPSIPLLSIGDIITKNIIENISQLLKNNTEIIGLYDEYLYVCDK